jgi:hypothetical protein
MPAERVSMRRVREILRLKFECGASDRAIAVAVAVARSTVQLCLLRAAAAGLCWPLPPTLTDQGLEAVLFASPRGCKTGVRHKAEPDWAAIHHELRRPGVTLLLFWEEYRAVHATGYGYSRWCELYRSWEARLSPTMRQAWDHATSLAVSMNVGPAVLTNSGPPAVSDRRAHAAARARRSASLFWCPPHGSAALRCAVVRRNR